MSDRLGGLPEWVDATLLSALLIAVSALAAWQAKQPLVFPSLGPTVYLLVESPMTRRASPRNTVIAHAIALLAGWVGLLAFGLHDTPAATETGVGPARVGAIVLALALTAAATIAARASHPPAAATTLIVAMGTFRAPSQLVVMLAGVLLLVVAGVVANRLRGLPMPWWSLDDAET